MATYGSGSRLRIPNRNKPVATPARVVKSAVAVCGIARGYEPARDGACDRPPSDAQPVAGLAKCVSDDNRRRPRRFGDGNSIRREAGMRFSSRLTNTRVGELLFRAPLLCSRFAARSATRPTGTRLQFETRTRAA